jgi:hypothetical protein
MVPLKLDVWGGLASQLSSLAYASWLLDNTDRQIHLRHYSEGTTNRSFEIPDLVSALDSSGRLDLVSVPSNGRSNSSNSRDTIRRVVRQMGIQAQRHFSPFHLNQISIDHSHLAKVKPWTISVKGYPLDWRLIRAQAHRIQYSIEISGRPNFLSNAGSEDFLAIHWRLGDYLRHPAARTTHGVIGPEGIRNGIYSLQVSSTTPIVVFTDSIEIARNGMKQISISNPIDYRSGDIWNDLVGMSRARWFLGSHSAVSVWSAIAISSCNPSAKIRLPNVWYKSPPKGISGIPLPPFPCYDPELTVDSNLF